MTGLSVGEGPIHHTIVEIDCFSRDFGLLSLNRESLDIRDDVGRSPLYELVASQVLDARLKVWEMHKESPFAILQYVITHGRAPETSNDHWLRQYRIPERDYSCWEKIKLPATKQTSVVPHKRLVFDGLELQEYSDFSIWEGGGSSIHQFWPFLANRVAVLLDNDNKRYLVPIWDSFTDSKSRRVETRACHFPDGWEHVVAATAPNLGQVWNANSHIVLLQNDEEIKWLQELEGRIVREELLKIVAGNQQKSAVFLLNILKSQRPERWTDIVEKYSDFARQIWDLTVGGDQRLVNIIQQLKEEQVITKCYVYTRNGFNESNELETLPLPANFVVHAE